MSDVSIEIPNRSGSMLTMRVLSLSARQRLIKEAARLRGHAVLLDDGSFTRIGDRESTEQEITGKVIVFTDRAGAN